MRLSAHDGLRGEWIDLDTGQKIRRVIWADPDTGEFEAWRFDELTCQRLYRVGMPESSLKVRGRKRLQFVPAAPEPAPVDLTPRNPQEQIAAICEIAPDYVKDWKPIVPVPGIECDEPKCHRLAEYETGDDHEIEPEKTPDGRLCQRAVTVAVHRYCPWHFRPPLHTTLRGVTSEKERIVRPQ